jgi:hypothetical protein
MAMTYAEAKERLLNIDFHAITLVPDTGIAATDIGKIGTISDIGEWGLGADAGTPFGVLKVFETDAVGVQDRGYAEIDIEHNVTASNEVTNGSWVELDGAGKGALAAAATGVRAVAVDATNHKAIVKLG